MAMANRLARETTRDGASARFYGATCRQHFFVTSSLASSTLNICRSRNKFW